MAFFSQPRFVYGFNWSSLGSLHSNCRNFSKVVVIFFEVQINFFFCFLVIFSDSSVPTFLKSSFLQSVFYN